MSCKQLDLRVARMSTKNGGLISIRRRHNQVLSQYFSAKYIDTQIKCMFFFTVYKVQLSIPTVLNTMTNENALLISRQLPVANGTGFSKISTEDSLVRYTEVFFWKFYFSFNFAPGTDFQNLLTNGPGKFLHHVLWCPNFRKFWLNGKRPQITLGSSSLSGLLFLSGGPRCKQKQQQRLGLKTIIVCKLL